MSGSLILDGRRAVVFGVGGSIGSAVARQSSADGAEVFFAGCGEDSLAAVTRQITGSGGRASYAVIDSLDDDTVDRYLGQITQRAGGIDIEFNGAGPRVNEYGTGTPATELPVKQFLAARDVLTTQFITARCAARRMVAQGKGVIISLTRSPARPHSRGTAAIGAAFAGIETSPGLWRSSWPASGCGWSACGLRLTPTPGPSRNSRTRQPPGRAAPGSRHSPPSTAPSC